MEYWFIRFYDIVKKYEKGRHFLAKSIYDRTLLSEEYKQWSISVLKDIEVKNAIELSELKSSVLLACDGYRIQYEKADTRLHNFASTYVSAIVAILIFTAGLSGGTAIIWFVCIIAIVYLYFSYTPYLFSNNESYVQFLYYSELLRIINTAESEKQRHRNKQRCFREQRHNR